MSLVASVLSKRKPSLRDLFQADHPSTEIATLLAESFHVLRGKPGVRPFDALKLDRWATGDGITTGERYAAQFVLSVWDAHEPWNCGRFHVTAAWQSWDGQLWNAFMDWAAGPFTL